MNKFAELSRIVPATDALKGRIVSFMHAASTEITPQEESRLPELAQWMRKIAAGAVDIDHQDKQFRMRG
jgi:hypothetical protein